MMNIDSLEVRLRYITKFRVICPECGHVGVSAWTLEENVVSCRKCKAKFDYRKHTFKPVRGRMSEDEWNAHRAEICKMASRRYYIANKEAVLERTNRYRDSHRESINAARRKLWSENRLENSKKVSDYRKRKLEELSDDHHPAHGTRWGYTLGCRCARCKKASHEYWLDYQARKFRDEVRRRAS